MTEKETKNQQIFVIVPTNYESESYFIGKKEFIRSTPTSYEVEETNLYDFVMESVDETTSPRGVESRLHIRENEEEETWELWTWGVGGNNPRFVESFDSEEDADNYIFEKTYEYDFLNDDQRDTSYYESEEEAQKALVERMADIWGVDEDIAKHIMRKETIVNKLRAERTAKAHAEEKERVEKLANIYAAMIEKIEGESYKETTQRLSKAIGERIEGKVFHKAVKLVRS